jgi:hypothetical protein
MRSSSIGFLNGLLEANIPACFLGLITVEEIITCDNNRKVKQYLHAGQYLKMLDELHFPIEDEKIADVLARNRNRVTIAHYRSLYGLEFPVVVDVPGRADFDSCQTALEEYAKKLVLQSAFGQQFFTEPWAAYFHLQTYHGLSRCTSQLIMFETDYIEAKLFHHLQLRQTLRTSEGRSPPAADNSRSATRPPTASTERDENAGSKHHREATEAATSATENQNSDISARERHEQTASAEGSDAATRCTKQQENKKDESGVSWARKGFLL